jgi:hypothetical protein
MVVGCGSEGVKAMTKVKNVFCALHTKTELAVMMVVFVYVFV